MSFTVICEEVVKKWRLSQNLSTCMARYNYSEKMGFLYVIWVNSALKPPVVNSRNVTVSVCRVKYLLLCSGEVLSVFRELGLSPVSHCSLGRGVQDKGSLSSFPFKSVL